MKIVVLKETDDEPKTVECGKEISLELMQKEVGGYVEKAPAYFTGPVDLLRNHEKVEVWCDEEGLMKGRLPNILWTHNAEGLRILVGNVVVTGKNMTPLPDKLVPIVIECLKGRRFVIEHAREAFKEDKDFQEFIMTSGPKEGKKAPEIIKGPWHDSSVKGYTGEGTRAIVQYGDYYYLIDVRWTAGAGNEAYISYAYIKQSGEWYFNNRYTLPLENDGLKGLQEFIHTYDWEKQDKRRDLYETAHQKN